MAARINIVVAMSSNRLIGRAGGLPWHLSSDLKRFKAITMGHPIVMGRKTHDSIGRALPGRLNIVVSGNNAQVAEPCVLVDSFERVLALAAEAPEIMVVGGASLYAHYLPLAQRIFLTEVDAEIEGDTFFPPFEPEDWREVERESFFADERNDHDYSFVVLERTPEGSA